MLFYSCDSKSQIFHRSEEWFITNQPWLPLSLMAVVPSIRLKFYHNLAVRYNLKCDFPIPSILSYRAIYDVTRCAITPEKNNRLNLAGLSPQNRDYSDVTIMNIMISCITYRSFTNTLLFLQFRSSRTVWQTPFGEWGVQFRGHGLFPPTPLTRLDK